MRNGVVRVSCITVCLLAVFCLDAAGDEVARQGRAILEKHKSAVVTVLLVTKQKISFPGMASQESESKVEATGTVIAPDGLTVMSLSLTDPTALMEAMMANSPRASEIKMEAEVRDVKILLEDDTEVPAEVILRDKDLDMAFVRPLTKPEEPFSYISLSDPGEPDYLDQVVSINRMGRVARRVYSASVERIDAIVKRPRTLYIPGKDPTNTGLGSPAFTLEGRFIGVFLIRVIKSTGGGRLGGLMGGASDNFLTVILPAVDIAEAAEQAPPFKE